MYDISEASSVSGSGKRVLLCWVCLQQEDETSSSAFSLYHMGTGDLCLCNMGLLTRLLSPRLMV